ncbi:hypothetical protein K440DRAFT_13477 [Wilcoxina mikolae CBS 423.85]|nr:hypothetical protein K440DRAFT_13477 [Wilcoxina mikolae CBS 423.85]
MATTSDHNFYRAQILGNAEVLFPSHNPKLISTQSRVLIVSSTTGETLLSKAHYRELLSDTHTLLDIKLNEGLKGSANGGGGGGGGEVDGGVSGGGEQQLRREMEELRQENGILREQLMGKKVEIAEAKLEMANMRNEELQKRIAVLEHEMREQGMDTPKTWSIASIGIPVTCKQDT